MLILIDNKLTAKNIGKLIGVTDRTVENDIAKLQKQKIIERIGSDKSGYWQIVKR
jgi:predicted HTH transcriptional regulator